MGLKYQYTVSLTDDTGSETEAIIQVGSQHDMLILKSMLEYSLDFDERLNVYPDPFDKVDDIRSAFKLTDAVTSHNDVQTTTIDPLLDMIDVDGWMGGEDI